MALNLHFRRHTPPTCALLGVLVATACTPKQTLSPSPHFVLGSAYQANGVWWYPREAYDLDETGLAAVIADAPAHLTADGEVYDPSALTGAHPTVQLPAIARLTNLENGREITIRLNDRGSGDPRRLVQISPCAATLLQIPPNSVARVRLRGLPAESHQVADALPGAPSLNMAAAPRGAVEVAELAPPPGARQGSGHVLPGAAPGAADPLPIALPLRLPETVTQTVPNPGRLMLHLDTFDEYQYAAVQQAKMRAFGARIVSLFEGRSHRFRVEVGPLPDVASADAALLQALNAGIPDARIVVD